MKKLLLTSLLVLICWKWRLINMRYAISSSTWELV